MSGGPSAILMVREDRAELEALARVLRVSGFRVDVRPMPTGTDPLGVGAPDLVLIEESPGEAVADEVYDRLKSDPATAAVPVVRVLREPSGEGLGRPDAEVAPPFEAATLLAALGRLLASHREDPARPLRPELAWQAALDGLGDAVALVDPDGAIARCNRAMGELLEIPAEELRGRELATALAGRGFRLREGLQRLVRIRRRRQVRECERDGRWYRIQADPLPGRDGEPGGIIVVIGDVSEARSLRARVAEAEAARLAVEARIAQLEREARVLTQFAEPSPGASRDGREALLRLADPGAFCDLVAEYEALMDLMLEQRSYRVEHQPRITERLRAMAERLGTRRAGPRDVVEVHGTALRRLGQEQGPQAAHALAEEGRLLVLELMGHLVSYYRTLTGSRRGPAAGGVPADDEGRKATG